MWQKLGAEVIRRIKSLQVYREAFTDLWEHVNALAVRKRLDTVNLGTEHSTHGDHEARVRSRGFIGPGLRSGVRFGWNPALSEITTEDVVWRGIVPNINVIKPQKRSLRSDLPGCCYQALLRRRSQDTSHIVAKRLQPHRRQQVIVQFRVYDGRKFNFRKACIEHFRRVS